LQAVDKASGDLVEAVFTSSPDAIVIVDHNGCIELASAAVEQLFGYTPDEVVGEQVELLVPEDIRAVHRGYRSAYAKHPGARSMGAGLDLHGRRRDGTIFPVDVSLSPVTVDGRSRTAAFVRDATERRRTESLMLDVNEITRRVLAGESPFDVLQVICEQARQLIGADAAWVMLPQDEDGDMLRVAAVDGAGVEDLLGVTAKAESTLSARAMDSGRPIMVADMHAHPHVLAEVRQAALGPGAYFPMTTQEGAIGALVVARRQPALAFERTEIQTAEVFASAAAVGLALGRARDSLEELRFVSEHERIARDLHDTVIQQLFALGMGLQGAQRLADEAVSDRIDEAVRAIDDVIREIRETIFDLNRPSGASQDVRQQVRATVAEAVERLGVVPQVTFRGPVEAAVSDRILSPLLAVLRESLLNIARHAHASHVEVVLMATAESVSLNVGDDGVGLPEEVASGHGLPSMAERAAALRGDCVVSRRRPTGTLVQWRVPTSFGGRASRTSG
jgi:PAS domain S-box-containing protein